MQANPTGGRLQGSDNERLRSEMEASTRALVSADEAHVQAAMSSVRWRRRGPLQRLTRDDR
ncbi:MAG: hypothetical protein QOK21_3023 [Solirubrobacteraceae bacterium]|jgi:hypothetical protein|nr:hypothetical protein [Solirubrobacteraceae bacterium]